MWNYFIHIVTYLSICRLSGVFPFSGNSLEEIVERNTEAELYYPKEIWKNVSSEALDLVMKMTDRDQYKRPSAKDCLNHPWFTIKPSKKSLKFVVENLRNFKMNHGERSKSTIRGMRFQTSSPMFVRKTSPDTSSKMSLSDFQTDSPLWSKDLISTIQTQKTQITSRTIRSASATKSHYTLSICELNNPFFSALNINEEESKIEADYTDEIPSEHQPKHLRAKSENSSVSGIDDFYGFPSIIGPEGMTKKLFVKKKGLINLSIFKKTPSKTISVTLNQNIDIFKNTSIKETKDSEDTPRSDYFLKKIKSTKNKYN